MSHLRRDVERHLLERVLQSINNKPNKGSIMTVIRETMCVSARSVRILVGKNVAERAQAKLGAKLRSHMMLALITEVIRRGSAQYCGILDRRIPLEKLTDYQGK